MSTTIADWKYVWLATVLFACLPWYFVSSGWLAYFDSWLVMGLVVVAFVPARWALAAACLLEPWIDERFVLALPTCFLVRAAALQYVEGRTRRSLIIDLGMAAGLTIPYVAMRLIFWSRGDEVTNFYLRTHAELLPVIEGYRYLAGLWSGFRAGWILVVAAVYFYARRAPWYWTLAFASSVVAMAVGGLFIAADMSRTMTVLVPVFLLAAQLWWSDAPRSGRWAFP